MTRQFTRRTALGLPLGAAALVSLPSGLSAGTANPPSWSSFPAQDPDRVRDTVLYAHSALDKVKALVEASPALANAAIDWGFGDWETALGAASHMGRRDMAELLMAHGARPDLFTHAMMGNLDAVKAAVHAMPEIQRTTGPHGITLLAHARQGKELARPVADYLKSLGDADPRSASEPFTLAPEAYLGTYAWSQSLEDRLDILEKDGSLRLKRGDGFPRNLVHLGQHEFHPAGASAVRVRFRIENERAVDLTVFDPEPILNARRIDG